MYTFIFCYIFSLSYSWFQIPTMKKVWKTSLWDEHYKMRCRGRICSEGRDLTVTHNIKNPRHPDCVSPHVARLLCFNSCLMAVSEQQDSQWTNFFWREIKALIWSNVWLKKIIYFSLLSLVGKMTLSSQSWELGCEVDNMPQAMVMTSERVRRIFWWCEDCRESRRQRV